ncbi:hypothetical protein DRQ53_01430 [bacterium]|nr:MAG: hypothetical protein DRQ53_01430 [bacterium]
MHLPRSLRALPVLMATIFIVVVCPSTLLAQTLVSHSERITFVSGLPEDTGSSWSRVGTGPVLLLDGGELLLNDNSPGEVVAYQGLLGQLEAEHDVAFRGELHVLSNIGGNAALIEISRPGMEVVVQLYRDQIVILERVGHAAPLWLGSVAIDMDRFRQIEVHKTSSVGQDAEQISVHVDGQELMRVTPRGGGELGLGRVLFGSMGYADMGATLWRWVEVEAQLEEIKIPVAGASLSSLKSRFSH